MEKLNWNYQKLLDDPEDPYSDEKDSPAGSSKSFISNRKWHQWHVLRIPFRHFIRFIISLPLIGFWFCVFWAIYTDYDKSSNVLCTRENNRLVRNYLPSLSAAIGDFQTSKLIWKICIISHSPGRFLFASMYFVYLAKTLRPEHVKWGVLACVIHVIENVGLLGLTIISSKMDLTVHAVNFAIFLIASQIYMVMLCILLSRCREVEITRLEARGLWVKKLLCKVSIISSLLLFVAYFRHEAKCEEGVYTLFALLEYIVVLANIGFNGSAYWDFYDKIIVLDLCEPCKLPVDKYSWDY